LRPDAIEPVIDIVGMDRLRREIGEIVAGCQRRVQLCDAPAGLGHIT
jgi:hypothetical protein